MKTQQHLRAESAASASTSSHAATDPWLQADKDPWKAASQKSAPSGKSHLQEVTGSIKDELTAAMQQKFAELQQSKTHGEAGGDEQQAKNTKRFEQIETSIGEMKAQQQQFTGWFNTLGQQVQAAEASIQGIQYTMSTHQSELQGRHHEIKNVSDHVGHAVQNALKNHKSEVSHDLDTRFDRLEALFSKKQRNE